MGPRADVLEHICVRSWARAFPGLTVVNFDYSLCPKERFPKQVQELLDFYLWLIDDSSKEEVIEIFGFIPEDIVITGESCGGQMASSVTVLLNELKQRNNGALKMPKGIILTFPKISANFQIYPSIYLSAIFDPIILFSLLTVSYHVYVPMKKFDPSTGSYSLISNKEQVILPPTAMLKDEYIKINNFLLNPLEYKNFDTLKDTSLSILTAEYDPFLDEAIQLAKRWEGKVDFRVLPDLGHVANHFRFFDTAAEEAAKELIDLIRTTFLH